MLVPYYVLLIIYLAGVLLFLVMTFFNMYHLMRFGFFDFTGKLNAFVFAGFTLAIITVTVLLLLDIPWLDTFNIGAMFDGFISNPVGNNSNFI